MRQNEPPLILCERRLCFHPHASPPPQASRTSNNIWDDWFCLRWTITGGAALPHPRTDANQHNTAVVHWGLEKLRHLILVVKESVDARSGAGVPHLHALVRRACGKQRTVNIFNAFYFFKLRFFKFYLETKWVLSGEKATLRTQDPCPLSVPARLACCL